MENFKSFGRKVVIPFFPGFTAITGPNGSGKSNIGDAIRFVLGPKSPKAIRAERLTDLIFNGGKNKKRPANYCEVSLVFDNRDRKLPVDSDTVVLTRRIKRAPLKDNPDNFYSYFYINGKSASLTDFVNILTKARISGEGYNLVKQGDVTSLIEMGPVERRKIIDEIAGISEFDKELEKAEKEKKEVEENIQRINIILDEVERQLAQLKKERDEAIRYRELQEKLHRIKAMISYKKKLDIEEQIADIQRQIESYEKEKKKLEGEKAKKKEEYQKTKAKLQEIENKIAQSGGEEAKKLTEKINDLRTEIAKLEERISNIKKSMKQLNQEKLNLKRSLDKVGKELSSLDNEIKNLVSSISQKERERDGIEKELKELRESLKESDKASMELSKELAKLRKEYDDLIQRKHELNLERERERSKMDTLKSKLSELEKTRETYETEIKDANWRIEEVKKERNRTIKRKEYLERKLFEKRKEEAELNQQLREINLAVRRLEGEYARLKAEIDANESMRKGYTTAVLKILEARDKGELKGIHGTVAELARVDPKYEMAMQIAGGNRLQAIIVDDDEVAAEAIEYLRRHNLGRATFLPLNKMIVGKPRAKALLAVEDEKSHGFAMDLVSFKKEYEGAFWYVFGDTVVVEDLYTARKWMGGVRLVTLKGDLIEASGAMIGGSTEKVISFSQVDRSKLDEIEDKLGKTVEARDSLIEKIESIRKEMEEMLKEKAEIEGKLSVDITEIETRKREFEAKLDVVMKEIEKKTGEMKEIEERVKTIESELDGIEKRLEEINRLKEEKGKLLVRGKKEEMVEKLKELEESLLGMKEELVSMNGELETLKKKRTLLETKREEMESRIREIEKELRENEEAVRELKEKKDKQVEEMETLISLETTQSTKLKGLSEEKDRIYREMVRMETEMDKISTRIESYVDLISRAKYRLSTVEDALKEVEKEMERYRDIIENISEKEIPSLDSLMESLRLTEENMHELEPVNMRALEEYEHQEERKKKLEEDIKKLREQKRDLNRVAKEIAKRKKDRFFEVFNEINDNFRDIYAELSGGGEAYLELENRDDPFAGGMNIKVRPKGKKVHNISALSGGEKSMASLALIFAIQRYDPSPFYVLDEIDMYLDNINAEAVSRMIKENSSYAQFILISLRKVTLKEADHIYGVTMREDGISEIIGAVDLSAIGPHGEVSVGGGRG